MSPLAFGLSSVNFGQSADAFTQGVTWSVFQEDNAGHWKTGYWISCHRWEGQLESDRNRPRLCILQKHIQAGKWPAEDSGAIILFLELCAFQLNMRAMVLRGLAKLDGRGKKEQNKWKALAEQSSYTWNSHLIINCNNLLDIQPKKAKMPTEERPNIALVHRIFLCLLLKPYPPPQHPMAPRQSVSHPCHDYIQSGKSRNQRREVPANSYKKHQVSAYLRNNRHMSPSLCN